jgi:hypothetical protein
MKFRYCSQFLIAVVHVDMIIVDHVDIIVVDFNVFAKLNMFGYKKHKIIEMFTAVALHICSLTHLRFWEA